MDVSESTAIQQTTNISSRSTYDNKGNRYAISALKCFVTKQEAHNFSLIQIVIVLNHWAKLFISGTPELHHIRDY